MAKKRVKNAQEMAKALNQIKVEFEADYVEIFRRGALQGRSKLILFTPKDSGWASRHWSQGLNSSHENESVTINSLTKLDLDDTVHLFNNVPYIKRLDEGWSTQRPSGFSHLVYQDLTQFFQTEFTKLSKEKAE